MKSHKHQTKTIDNFIGSSDGIIWSMFRCADVHCNRLLTKEDHDLGRCGGCQGIRFIISRYLTPKEVKAIKAGKLIPHRVNLDEIGPEPPTGVE